MALRIISLLLVLLACGCGEDAVTGPSSQNVSVRGQVVDFRTRASVPGALVQFASEHQSASTTATTDADGFYVITVPSFGPFVVSVDGAVAGTARVTRPRYRGDLLVDGGTCVSRYGTIADARTLVPILGATVSLGGRTTTTEFDGWYRIDFDCPPTGLFGSNTTFLYVTHPNYAGFQRIAGRGIYRISRMDVYLERP